MRLFTGSPRANAPHATDERFCNDLSLGLPPGDVIASDGVQHQADAHAGRTVVPLFDEAYVIVQLKNGIRWYATWHPYAKQWETQRVEPPWILSTAEEAALAL